MMVADSEVHSPTVETADADSADQQQKFDSNSNGDKAVEDHNDKSNEEESNEEESNEEKSNEEKSNEEKSNEEKSNEEESNNVDSPSTDEEANGAAETEPSESSQQKEAPLEKQEDNNIDNSPTEATSTNSTESAVNDEHNVESKETNTDVKESTPTPEVSLSESDPNIVKIKFLFANRDGLNVTVECQATDTVGEIKGALLSVWPDDLPECNGGENVRLICMGKGILMPDSKTLADCQVPVFKTHPTPINVSVKPEHIVAAEKAQKSSTNNNESSSPTVNQGCFCVIM